LSKPEGSVPIHLEKGKLDSFQGKRSTNQGKTKTLSQESGKDLRDDVR
jgi:hypothetical protein